MTHDEKILKPAQTDIPIADFIRQRWSPRAFDASAVPEEKLRQVLEAARWAASSRNSQPWRFIIARHSQPEEYARLLACLDESNQVWAKTAPVLLLSVAQMEEPHRQRKNRHAWHDVGLAVGGMLAQATALGLHAHLMGGFSATRACETYAIPAEYEPVTAIALGYLGAVSRLPESQHERERNTSRRRQSLAEMVFSGEWGNSPGWVGP
jgi:nitroreductase